MLMEPIAFLFDSRLQAREAQPDLLLARRRRWCTDFDINSTHLASLASTTAVSTVRCRVMYVTAARHVVLIGDISAWLCPNLGPTAGLVSIAAKCAIVELNLHGCRRLTDVALRAFGERLGTLEVLDVGSCNQLSDKGFAALTCGRLKTLTVSACPCLTDAGLKSIT